MFRNVVASHVSRLLVLLMLCGHCQLATGGLRQLLQNYLNDGNLAVWLPSEVSQERSNFGGLICTISEPETSETACGVLHLGIPAWKSCTAGTCNGVRSSRCLREGAPAKGCTVSGSVHWRILLGCEANPLCSSSDLACTVH